MSHNVVLEISYYVLCYIQTKVLCYSHKCDREGYTFLIVSARASNTKKNKRKAHQYEPKMNGFLCDLAAINGSKGG